MTRNIVGTPVKSAASWEDELALLFAKGSEKEARARAARHDAQRRSAIAKAKIAAAQTAISKATADRVAADKALAMAEALHIRDTVNTAKADLEKGQGNLLKAAIGAFVAFVALGLATDVGALHAVGLAAAAALFFYRSQQTSKVWQPAVDLAIRERDASTTARNTAIAEAKSAQGTADGARTTAEASLKDGQKSLTDADADSAKPIPDGVNAVVRGYLPFRVLDMAGYSVVVDSIGLVDEVPVALPDLVHDLDALQSIQERVTRFETPPVLLRASGKLRNEVDAVYGEEEELRDTMQDWVETMREIPVLRGSLRIVPSTSPISSALKSGVTKTADVPGTVWTNAQHDSTTLEFIRQLDQCFAKARAVGGDGESALTETYERLRAVMQDYGARRSEALQMFQSNVHSVLARSSLLSVHCYCPRCNRVPEYMYMKLGVPFDDAHLADQQQLLQNLSADPEIAQRMATQPTLVNDFETAWRSLGSLAEEEAALHSRVESMPKALAEQRVRAFQSQRNAVLSEYRGLLRHIVLGNSRASVELGRASRLHLDPETFAWTCAACNSTWTDLDIVSMGRVLRVKDDLLMPMWNHLWTEKDDFRKSEIFRTNEQLATFSEKEGEKLLNIAESYKSDLRGVRERIIDASASAESARIKLFSTLDGLVDMDLMTTDKARSVRERIEGEGGDSVKAFKRKAESNEMLLLAEPQAQLRRRSTAVDPIRLFTDPSALFTHVPPLLAEVPEAAQLTENVASQALLGAPAAVPAERE